MYMYVYLEYYIMCSYSMSSRIVFPSRVENIMHLNLPIQEILPNNQTVQPLRFVLVKKALAMSSWMLFVGITWCEFQEA